MAVTLVVGGPEAMAILDGGIEFDLAVLDMQMPGMDGVELAHRIKAMSSYAMMPLVLC